MTRSLELRDPNVFEAMFATDLPGMVGENQLPNDLMWMPPGTHAINASRGGKPAQLTVTVDASTADVAQRSLAAILATASAGQGDAPFIDFNHDDQEAAGWAKAFRWGGDDPQRGGVRLELEWSGAGKRAILGRDYSRFSPSFYTDDAGQLKAIPVNCGGLVNRAAFQRIAPIMSKRAEADALTTKTDFLTKAKAMSRARNISEVDAMEYIARNNPYLYDCYRWEVLGLGGGPPKKPERPPVYETAAYRNEFCLRARALADALGMSEAKAIDVLGHEQPALYLRYRSQLGLGDARRVAQEIADVQARTVDSPFFALAKQIAAQRSIDLSEAFPIAASARPELADYYQGRS